MRTIEVIEKEAVWEDTSSLFNNCHCSSLLRRANGDMLVVYFAGDTEGAPNLAIWQSRRAGGKWEKPRRIKYLYGFCHWNPLLHQDGDETILYYKVGMDVPSWYTMKSVSRDFGATWSDSVEAVTDDHTPTISSKNKILVASDGSWLGPCSVERSRDWDSYIDISVDRGQSWTRHTIPFDHNQPALSGGADFHGLVDLWISDPDTVLSWDGIIQPALWESAPGRIHCLMRSTKGCLYRSDSDDYGRTWCVSYPTDLPNNNSGIDLVRMEDGVVALVCNPVAGNWTARSPLSILLSEDNGATWSEPVHLETGDGEYSYPAVLSDGDRLYVTYTSRRKRIIHSVLRVV